MSEYGKIAQDEVVSRWEDDVDEIGNEFSTILSVPVGNNDFCKRNTTAENISSGG